MRLRTREPSKSQIEMVAVALGPNHLDLVYAHSVVSLELVAPNLSQFSGVDAVAAEKTVHMPRRGVPRLTRVAQQHLSSAATQNEGRIETAGPAPTITTSNMAMFQRALFRSDPPLAAVIPG